MNLFDKHPVTDPSVFVAPNATVVGNVTIAHKSNVWYGAVVRGETGQALQRGCGHTLRFRSVRPDRGPGALFSARNW